MTAAVLPPLEGAIIPSFELPRAGGGSVRVRAYRGRRSLALYFLHDAGCVACRSAVAAILPRYGDYAQADAEPLVIVPGPLAGAEALRAELALPFPVLADEEGTAGRRYGVQAAGEPAGAALLLTDRYGAPAVWQPAGADHPFPEQQLVLRELEYLAHTCGGGCVTPIWSNG